MSEDRFNLERFVRRQESDYDRAYKELSEESKRSHWMWWIFPQITGLGMTSTSQEYSIKSLAEAKAYLEHPVLGKNIREISKLLTTIHSSNASIVFGYPDDMKLRSSMTLFAEAAESDEDRNIFLKVLDKFFDGKKDTRTLAILRQIGGVTCLG